MSGKSGKSGFDGVIVSIGQAPYRTEIHAGDHLVVADEPADVGGKDAGMNPYQLVLAGLGACKAITVRMYADRKGWALKQVVCTLRHERRHAEDCETCDEKEPKLDHIDVEMQFVGELDGAQRERLHEISSKCPVHRTLTSETRIASTLVEE